MAELEDIIADAHARGLRPWIAVKERLSEAAIQVMARAGAGVVLQGGAALHFAYGSPRLSADVDFVGSEVASVLARLGPLIARAAGDLLERPTAWSIQRAGRLWRGKVTLKIDAARLLALPIEALEIPAYHPSMHPRCGLVEDPSEIVADKVVASADRFARRRTLKATDLFDLWYLSVRLGAPPPDSALVARKMEDYHQEPQRADLRGAVRAFSPDELGASLDGLVPASERSAVNERQVLEAAASLLGQYQDGL